MASALQLISGQNVRLRGLRAVITGVTPSSVDPECAKIEVRVTVGERQGDTFSVFVPVDDIEPEELPPLKLDALASFPLWSRYHDAFRLELALPPDTLISNPQAQIEIDDYQMVPAKRLLSLPRPRLLIADDVGLGKTIEAGLAYLELAQRRLAKRVLIVAPASICKQWQDEFIQKFGIHFDIFDRETVDGYRRQAEIGANPWLLRPRIIVSIDTAKMDATFAELRRTAWDLAIIDEAHHVTERDEENITRNRVFARWLAQNARGLLLLSATPHDGNDESLASLLRLLEPRIAIRGAGLSQGIVRDYVVRRLKRDIRKSDGSPKFVPRAPVQAIPVILDEHELQIHRAVMETIAQIKVQARRAPGDVRSRVDFLATILRKRLASSRAALERTIESRRETLAEDLDAISSRRDLLRRARASEPLTDAEQAQLERELHAASIQGAQQALSRGAKASGAEDEAFGRLQQLCEAAREQLESKVQALIAQLEFVWAGAASENVIVFTEYKDTAEALAGEHSPLRERFRDRVILLHGDINGRDERLAAFCKGEGKLLVATDVASEGLNLQERCRTVIHYDLPWNPNRLEQRNGRVDRFGQTREPRIAFLYAKETYDGELLRMLAEKIAKQIDAIGSVGDVLGSLQPGTIEDLFDEPAPTMTAELTRSLETRVTQIVEGASAPGVMHALESSSERVLSRRQPELGAFVVATINHFDGRAHLGDRVVEVDRYPNGWGVQNPATRYALPGGPSDLPLLTLYTAVARASINAMRELRYDVQNNPRVAARTHALVERPVLVGTFLCSVRSRDGFTEERLEAIGIEESGLLFDDAHELLSIEAHPEPMSFATIAREAFGAWWQRGYDRVHEEAMRLAESWAQQILEERRHELARHRAALNDWYAAERNIATRGHGDASMLLFEESATASTKRELERVEADRKRQLAELDDRASIEQPVCDPLGILLVMPAPK